MSSELPFCWVPVTFVLFWFCFEIYLNPIYCCLFKASLLSVLLHVLQLLRVIQLLHLLHLLQLLHLVQLLHLLQLPYLLQLLHLLRLQHLLQRLKVPHFCTHNLPHLLQWLKLLHFFTYDLHGTGLSGHSMGSYFCTYSHNMALGSQDISWGCAWTTGQKIGERAVTRHFVGTDRREPWEQGCGIVHCWCSLSLKFRIEVKPLHCGSPTFRKVGR